MLHRQHRLVALALLLSACCCCLLTFVVGDRVGSTLYHTADVTPSERTPASLLASASASTSASSSSRRLLSSAFPSSAYPSNSDSFPGAVDRWTSCFPGDGAAHRVSIGVAVDVGFYNLFNSRQEVENYVALQFSIVNRIYLQQLSLQFVVGELLIMDEPGVYAWNHQPNPSTVTNSKTHGVCDGATISSVLDDFTAWRRDYRPNSMGLWHLFTNCFPPPGTVGLSWIGALCRSDIGTGVSSFSSTMWLTIAHELGHNLGAQHSFQMGEGKTGGIMDYADGSYPLGSSLYQFNSLYSKDAICGVITQAMQLASSSSGDTFSPYCIDRASPYSSRCGNGIVEVGEQCDDDSPCCDPRTCLLGVGMQCSPGKGAVDGDSQCCQNCLFVPSTKKCNVLDASDTMKNSLGYCANGNCKVSTCVDFYGSLEFCGVKDDNPCRQTCKPLTGSKAGVCTDAFTTPSMNLPLSTVCSLSPYSTCQLRAGTNTMECVATSISAPASFAWVSGPWSTCLGECGTGAITRTVSCIDASTGLPAASELSCAGTKPIDSEPCELASCPKYAWSEPNWSPCDTDCGTGLQQNRPRCMNLGMVQPVVVPSAYCSSLPAPPVSQPCVGVNGPTCPLAWKYTAYSQCTETCGGGVALSTRTCVQTRNAFTYTQEDSACVAANVPNTQELSVLCNTLACPAYYWKYGIWTACSATCNGGVQVRSATCIESATSSPASDPSKCSDPLLNPLAKEPLQQTCRTNPCPVYKWVQSSPWSECSVACGGGEQYALIQCFDTAQVSTSNPNPNGVAVADQFCVQTRPLGTKSCNTQNCPDYHYRAGVWTACSANCNGGTMTRVVSCHNMQGVRMADCTLNNCPDVDDKFCIEKGLTKPPSSSPCNQQSCFTAMWWTQDFGDCSASCNGGVQTREVHCVSTGTFGPVAESQCGGSKPSSSQACNTQKCSAYQFVPGSWSPCTAACGGGTRTRALTCIFGGALVSNDQCTQNGAAAPETTGACNTQSCATFWWTSDFGTCSKQCEYGQATRTVECRSSNTAEGVKVADDQCTATKPASSAVCNVFPCPAWVTSDWSACSVKCGDGGTKTRAVLCLSFDNQIVANEQCVHNMPVVSQPCDLITSTVGEYTPETQSLHQPCPHWHRSDWSDCSRPCGSGTQTRTLQCRMPHDDVWQGRLADESLCPAGYSGADAGPLITTGSDLTSPGATEDQSTPAMTQTCNTNPCQDYYWLTTWSDCSVSCDGGIQSSSAVCMRSADDTQVEGNLCLDVAPPASRSCNTQPCPTYEWFSLTEWGACSSQCGGNGVQIRSIRCRDRTPNLKLMIKYELAIDDKCAGLPKPESQRACTHSVNACYGLVSPLPRAMIGTEEGMQRVNGVCGAEGKCVCRPGYGLGGTNCNIAPAITEVVINGLQYNQLTGIPFGESIQLTWLSTPQIEYVQVLLVNDWLPIDGNPIPFPQLITSRLLNNGSLVWPVGTGLPYGLGDGGGGFRLRVRFDSQIYADSETALTLANPCGYVSCGKQGRCVTGGVCQCNPGWSGKQCQLSPCEAVKCSALHSTCLIGPAAREVLGVNSTASAGIGDGDAYCACLDGWTGTQCSTPPGCTPQCVNGGDFVISGIVSSIGDFECPTQCRCTNAWDPSTKCATCALQCQNGGTADGSCSSCVCAAGSGYFGSQCQCNYYLIRLGFKFDLVLMPGMADATLWSSSPTLLRLIGETLTRDFAAALGFDANYLTVQVVQVNSTGMQPGQAVVEVQFAKACVERAFEVAEEAVWILDEAKMNDDQLDSYSSYAEAHRQLHHKLNQRSRRKLLQDAAATIVQSSNVTSVVSPTADLSVIYAALASQLVDTAAPIYRGVLTSHLDASYSISVSDPSGRDAPIAPGTAREAFVVEKASSAVEPIDGGSDSPPVSNALAIALAVIGVGLLLALAVFLLFRYYRRASREIKHSAIPTGYDPGVRRESVTMACQTSPEPEDDEEHVVPAPAPGSLFNNSGTSNAAGSRRGSRRGSHFIMPSAFALGLEGAAKEQDVVIGTGSLENDPAMSGLRIPLYGRSSVGSGILLGQGPSSSAANSGANTPAGIEMSAPSSAASSAQVSRRGSDADQPLTATLLQRRPPQMQQQQQQQQQQGMSTISPALMNTNLPPGLPRGSFIQSIRVVNPNAPQAPTVCASPSALADEALLTRTFDEQE